MTPPGELEDRREDPGGHWRTLDSDAVLLDVAEGPEPVVAPLPASLPRGSVADLRPATVADEAASPGHDPQDEKAVLAQASHDGAPVRLPSTDTAPSRTVPDNTRQPGPESPVAPQVVAPAAPVAAAAKPAAAIVAAPARLPALGNSAVARAAPSAPDVTPPVPDDPGPGSDNEAEPPPTRRRSWLYG
jgi:hypothetical protein